MFSKEDLDEFKRQYKKEHGKDLSNEEALAIAIFENAILQTKNFVYRIEKEKGYLEENNKNNLTEYIFSCSLSLIMIYLSLNKKFNRLHFLVLEEYGKFIDVNSGLKNEKDKFIAKKMLYEELTNNMLWLSTSFPVDKKITISKISDALSRMIASREHEVNVDEMIESLEKHGTISQYGQLVDGLINDIEISMIHFGII